jgi:hypothetical protein
MCQSAFHHCDKIPKKNQLIRSKVLFWLTILKVSVHGHLTCHSGSVVTQYIMTGAHGGGDLLISWQPGNKEKARKGPETQYLLPRHIPSDLASFL